MEPGVFGWALKKLREGKKVSRYGWNGSGMWIVIQKGYGLVCNIAFEEILSDK